MVLDFMINSYRNRQRKNSFIYVFLIFLVFLFFVMSAVLFIRKDKLSGKPVSGYVYAENLDKVSEDIKQNSDEIYVDLSGAVVSPGLYTFSLGARIFDLLAKGGGLLKNSDPEWVMKQLNLAKKLYDEEKVYIPFEWDFAQESSHSVIPLIGSQSTGLLQGSLLSNSAQGSGKVNVNTATQLELESLPGIGQVYGRKIIENRPYTNFDNLSQKTSISLTILEKIKSSLVFN